MSFDMSTVSYVESNATREKSAAASNLGGMYVKSTAEGQNRKRAFRRLIKDQDQRLYERGEQMLNMEQGTIFDVKSPSL